MPVVGQLLATRVDDTFPRILNWEARRIFKLEVVVEMVYTDEQV